MKFYIAARFPRRLEMEEVADKLKEIGWTPNCRWVFGGEEGLTRTEIAELDLEDVYNSDVIVLFTEPYGSPQPGGGRFVEFVYALALGKICYVIGEYENVFMHDLGVKVYPTLGDLLRDNSKQP